MVNNENKIVGTGYNGMPLGCSDDELPWDRVADDALDTKYPYGQYSGKIYLHPYECFGVILMILIIMNQ